MVSVTSLLTLTLLSLSSLAQAQSQLASLSLYSNCTGNVRETVGIPTNEQHVQVFTNTYNTCHTVNFKGVIVHSMNNKTIDDGCSVDVYQAAGCRGLVVGKAKYIAGNPPKPDGQCAMFSGGASWRLNCTFIA